VHALNIIFTQGLPEEEYQALCDSFVAAADSIDGLVAKTFLRNGPEAGGFYLFREEQAADAYLAGPIVAQLAAIEAISDVVVRRYAVDVEHSLGTGLGRLVGA
jgi:hypothetical protein